MPDRILAAVRHRLRAMTLVAILAAAVCSLDVGFASAATVCNGDVCVIVPDATLATPLGTVTVTVSAGNVVTVQLDPLRANTLVVGVPFTLPGGGPVSGCPGGCTRTTASVDTSAGTVTVDTFQIPPGPPARFSLPSLMVIGIHPPGPCRVRTAGTTVVFTPIIPPGPPA